MVPSVKKRRVTLNLDEDVVEALQAIGSGDRSMSAVANDALREAVEKEGHRLALLEWLDELDATYGRASDEERAKADALLDELHRGTAGDTSAA